MLKNHNVRFESFTKKADEKIQKYFVEKIDSVFLEELMLPDPKIKVEETMEVDESKFYFVPINQLHSNMLVLGLEPQSMIGIIVYDEYKNWIKAGKYYPVMRVVSNN